MIVCSLRGKLQFPFFLSFGPYFLSAIIIISPPFVEGQPPDLADAEPRNALRVWAFRQFRTAGRFRFFAKAGQHALSWRPKCSILESILCYGKLQP